VKINPASSERRINDGKVDPGGRFWAGMMGPGAVHHLYRLDGSHTLCVMESGITISNGIGWSPDD
jgi:sugar lactone lactonase YvrE